MSIPILKPNSSWFAPTSNVITRSIITLINIVDTYTPAGNVVDSWDASAAQDGSIMCYVEDTTLTIAGNGSGKIALSEDASYTFSNSAEIINSKGASEVEGLDTFSAVTAINGLELLDTSSVTTMAYMFHRCKSLTSVDVSSFDTSNVTNMSHMFGAIPAEPMALTAINFGEQFVTNKVTDTSYMMYYNNNLLELNIDDWDVSNVTTMSNMFKSCEKLTTFGPNALANWNTGNVVYMDQAFRWLKKLTAFNLEHWDVSKVKTLYACFCNGAWTTVLDLDAWDTSSCEDVSFMFHSFKTLTTLKVNGWDVRNVRTFDHFIAQMSTNFKNMDVSNWQVTNKCENLNAVFHGFKGTTLDVSGWDTSNVKVFCQMFDGCSNLTEIIGLQDLDTSSGRDFTEMFAANKIKHLDLSFLDTRRATPGYPLGANGTNGGGVHKLMYGTWNSLEKITVGSSLSRDGDGTCVENVEIHHDGYPGEVEVLNCRFTIPSPKTGYWYDLEGNQYLNTEIPDDTAGVYFSTREAALKEAETKKYVSLSGLRTYHTLQEAKIAEQLSFKSDSDHTHEDDYEVKGAAATALSEAKSYTDEAVVTVKAYADEAAAAVKNDLLNGAGEAYDTLKELGDLIDENVDAITALETIATGKADAVHSHDDLYYTKAEIDADVEEINHHIEDIETNIEEINVYIEGIEANIDVKCSATLVEANSYTSARISALKKDLDASALVEVTTEEINALFE